MRVQGWDPVLIICQVSSFSPLDHKVSFTDPRQIVSLQAIHYLTLSLLTPSLLSLLTSPPLLEYSGGPSTVAHILDWREMAGRPTISSAAFGDIHRHAQLSSSATSGLGGWRYLGGAWAGGKHVGVVEGEEGIGAGTKGKMGADEQEEVWDFGVDDGRGWVEAGLWLLASAVDIVPLYYLVRRPTFILDFSLTLNLVHLILTTYYAKAFPTSLFYWVIQALGALLMITIAEQLCVKRELSSDLEVSTYEPVSREEEGIPLQQR
ncbi:integral membrane protein S linking to the trans Golgi network-domain-containing protein [Dioszegia hungarica]|uniref:Integral membrane protein S linking to the trans Golgi network-domain-containing protein n=1 Tax=Dioszegia hungarica TaxID=4972 RepID=A0AA38LRM8_9TREE|nr:integral membrane protein S linking to the trans Golgi network-domain-containing protein [Dioszegia hungarica]KAI9632698.1 integral membrane protein S linking to the trans Golgi network-domain-containing protein [Dioszegia hungarica]